MSAYATEPPVTLPDFIARAISDDSVARWNDTKAAGRVLASEEMQAIRKALLSAAWDVVDSYTNWDTVDDALRGSVFNLPPSVVAWVLEGEQ